MLGQWQLAITMSFIEKNRKKIALRLAVSCWTSHAITEQKSLSFAIITLYKLFHTLRAHFTTQSRYKILQQQIALHRNLANYGSLHLNEGKSCCNNQWPEFETLPHLLFYTTSGGRVKVPKILFNSVG